MAGDIVTGAAWQSQFAHLLRSPADVSQGDNPVLQRAVITLHDGTRITIDDADVDEIIRFVDMWQSGRRGRADLNGFDGNGTAVKVPVEYRDVLRVDFPEAT